MIALIAVRPLVPRGTLTARRGLPSVILTRGLVSAAFFGAEVYLPYLLVERYAFSPTFAGLTLTGGALAWAGGSAVQGRLGTRLDHRRAIRIGSAMVLGAVVLALVTTVLGWPAAVAIAGWMFAGGGMGLMYPRLSVMTLAMSTPDTEGFNSSAMSISDSLGGALALATTGIVFTAFTDDGGVLRRRLRPDGGDRRRRRRGRARGSPAPSGRPSAGAPRVGSGRSSPGCPRSGQLIF